MGKKQKGGAEAVPPRIFIIQPPMVAGLSLPGGGLQALADEADAAERRREGHPSSSAPEAPGTDVFVVGCLGDDDPDDD